MGHSSFLTDFAYTFLFHFRGGKFLQQRLCGTILENCASLAAQNKAAVFLATGARCVVPAVCRLYQTQCCAEAVRTV